MQCPSEWLLIRKVNHQNISNHAKYANQRANCTSCPKQYFVYLIYLGQFLVVLTRWCIWCWCQSINHCLAVVEQFNIEWRTTVLFVKSYHSSCKHPLHQNILSHRKGGKICGKILLISWHVNYCCHSILIVVKYLFRTVRLLVTNFC